MYLLEFIRILKAVTKPSKPDFITSKLQSGMLNKQYKKYS